MKLFKPKYRITRHRGTGYEVSYRKNPFSFWYYIDCADSIEAAYLAVERHKKRLIEAKELSKFVEYVE